MVLLLLGGKRRFELVQCLVSDLYVDVRCDGDKNQITTGIDLRAKIAKNNKARKIPFASFTTLGTELLRHIKATREPGEWLSELGYNAMDDALRSLPHYRCFDEDDVKSMASISSHVYRRTCDTYEMGLPHDVKTKMKRQGHTLAQATASYIDPPDGMGRGDTLEQVMQCEDALRAIVDAVKARDAKGVKPRTEHRRRPERSLVPRQKGPAAKLEPSADAKLPPAKRSGRTSSATPRTS
jgi:hypothetical protein